MSSRPEHREAVHNAFEGDAVSVRDAVDAVSALQNLRTTPSAQRANLVIADIDVPGMEPGELVEHIKSDESLRTIPVVTIADTLSNEHLTRVYNAHGAGVIVRPSDRAEFENRLRAVATYWLGTVQLPNSDAFTETKPTATYLDALPTPSKPTPGLGLARVLLLGGAPDSAVRLLELLNGGERRFVVEHALRFDEAKRRLEAASVDVIVSDLDVADSKGLDTLDRLLAQVGDVPIIVRCGSPDQADEAMTRGADDIWPADAAVDEIPAVIRRTLVRREVALKRAADARIQAISQLAGGVGHGFNNLLTVVDGYATLIGDVTDDDEVQSYAGEIRATAERAARLTKHLLRYGRREALVPQILDLNEFLLQRREHFANLAGTCRLQFELADDLPAVLADRNALEVVVENLILNAVDAMPEGGTISIGTRPREVTPRDVRAATGAYVGDFVCLSVRDEGTGMNAATLQRIWTPFFTTKRSGRGAGLGLSSVEGVVAQHRGWVEVVSVPDHGTAFDVAFPVTIPTESASHEQLRARHSEAVLVVDPVALIREAICTTLQSRGYTTLRAKDGEEALALLRGDANVDVLITDMAIPGGMGGIELLRALRRMPDYPEVLFFSGYPADVIEFDENTNLTRRPYQSRELLHEVARAAEAARQRRK